MDTKDIVFIEDTHGNNIQFEVVTIYTINNSNYKYIIYRNLKKTNYYIAKYLGEEIADLDTNLTDEEIQIGNKILKGVIK